MDSVAIVDYGMGNLQSVRNAFEFLGASVDVTDSPARLAKAPRVVLPGVGAFATGMKNLKERKLDAFLRESAGKKPLLGICLGMQLLAERGHEGGETEGLGLLAGEVKRFDSARMESLRVPHVGWNDVRAAGKSAFFDESNQADYYFVHSYFFDAAHPENVLGTCEYGGTFPAIVGDEARKIYGAQFHPEKSHGHGLRLLKRFLECKC